MAEALRKAEMNTLFGVFFRAFSVRVCCFLEKYIPLLFSKNSTAPSPNPSALNCATTTDLRVSPFHS